MIVKINNVSNRGRVRSFFEELDYDVDIMENFEKNRIYIRFNVEEEFVLFKLVGKDKELEKFNVRMLHANWTIEESAAIKVIHGMSVEDILADQKAEELANEMDKLLRPELDDNF